MTTRPPPDASPPDASPPDASPPDASPAHHAKTAPTLLDATARRLEGLLRTRRRLGNDLLNADMFERWGPPPGPERAAMEAEAAASQRAHAEVSAALTAAVAAARQVSPGSVVAWAEAHRDLLDAFVYTATDATGRFVAEQERDAWAEVAGGARAWVDENVFYVAVDAARHRAWFGELPAPGADPEPEPEPLGASGPPKP